MQKCDLCLSKKTSGQKRSFLSTFIICLFRGKGLGNRLLEGLLARADISTPIYLTTIERSKGFFLKNGFEEIPANLDIPL